MKKKFVILIGIAAMLFFRYATVWYGRSLVATSEFMAILLVTMISCELSEKIKDKNCKMINGNLLLLMIAITIIAFMLFEIFMQNIGEEIKWYVGILLSLALGVFVVIDKPQGK